MSWTITFKMPDRLFGSVNRGEAGAPLGLPSQGIYLTRQLARKAITQADLRPKGARLGRFDASRFNDSPSYKPARSPYTRHSLSIRSKCPIRPGATRSGR